MRAMQKQNEQKNYELNYMERNYYDKKGELKVVMGYIMHYLYEKSNT